MDFIAHVMDEAYEGNVPYNVDDMRNAILGFAASSTNQAETCLKIVAKMHFKSKDDIQREAPAGEETPLIFFDVEVFQNLLLVNWKFAKHGPVHRMVNPAPDEMSARNYVPAMVKWMVEEGTKNTSSGNWICGC